MWTSELWGGCWQLSKGCSWGSGRGPHFLKDSELASCPCPAPSARCSQIDPSKNIFFLSLWPSWAEMGSDPHCLAGSEAGLQGWAPLCLIPGSGLLWSQVPQVTRAHRKLTRSWARLLVGVISRSGPCLPSGPFLAWSSSLPILRSFSQPI